MGNFFSWIFGKKLSNIFTFVKEQKARILILGLDASGKTTMLYKLKLPDEVITTIPTIGFNVEEVKINNFVINMWDVGGEDKIHALWKHYFANTDALIYMIDSNDRERLDKGSKYGNALTEFKMHVYDQSDELQGIPILFFLNKQDLPKAITKNEFENLFEVKELFDRLDSSGNTYFCQPLVATKGEGLIEGFDWLTLQMKLSMKTRKEIKVLRDRWKKEKWTFKNHPIFPKSTRTAVWGLMLFSEKKQYICKDVFQHIIQFLPIKFVPSEKEIKVLTQNMKKY